MSSPSLLATTRSYLTLSRTRTRTRTRTGLATGALLCPAQTCSPNPSSTPLPALGHRALAASAPGRAPNSGSGSGSGSGIMPPRKQRKTSRSSRPTAGDVDGDPSPDSGTSTSGTSAASASARSAAHLAAYPAENTHRLLEPGPVLLISTRSAQGVPNLMTCGFHMPLQHSGPPLVALVLGQWDHSYAALAETGECVLAVPGVDLAQQVVDVGNCSGEDVDKWARFAFTPLPAEAVQAPLVGEALACVECRVRDRRNVSRYGMWVLEPVRAWVNGAREETRSFHHRGDGRFVVDGEELDLRERMTKWKYLQD
ncbi:hypothetical protein CALCODRAFT_481571 [Calocera cornea HHB12733]|uniref:Flavin reductase like domain-containing protein n=1 Tax=Calocera cornea HHB12733 TaxID=1353952 RepID=A0A165HN92_9BASI|nr:hypothetical protein CALCODRAFT_481571 [Calocera cornea HHB12733]